MVKKKYFILSMLILCTFSILVIIVSNMSNEVPPHMTELNTIVSEFNYLNDVEVGGISPTLFITFDIDKNTPVEDIDIAFLRVRDTIMKKEVFEKLMIFHKERYGGTVIDLRIQFVYDNNHYHSYYSDIGHSGNPNTNSFRDWRVNRNGERKDF